MRAWICFFMAECFVVGFGFGAVAAILLLP